MAYFYIKTGGTATGDGGRYATIKTGTWATAFSATSEYYGTLQQAFYETTTPAANGDYYLLSHSHDTTEAQGSPNATELDFGGGGGLGEGQFYYVISVDNAAVDTPKPGAKIKAEAGAYFWFTNGIWMYGVYIESDNGARLIGDYDPSSNSLLESSNSFYGGVRTISRSSGTSSTPTASVRNSAIAQEIEVNPTDQYSVSPDVYRQVYYTGAYQTFGLSIVPGSTQPNELTYEMIENDDRYMQIFGADLSEARPDQGFFETPSSGASANMAVEFYGLKLPSGYTGDLITSSTFSPPPSSQHARISIRFLNYGEGADDWAYYEHGHRGTVEATKAVYYNSAPQLPDGSRFGWKVDTNYFCTLLGVWWLALPVKRMNLNDAGQNTITLKLAYTGSGLTDVDAALLCGYPDNTTPNLLNFAASYPTCSGTQCSPDFMQSSTELTETGEALTAWTGLSSGDSTYDLSITVNTATAHPNSNYNPFVFLRLAFESKEHSLYVNPDLILS